MTEGKYTNGSGGEETKDRSSSSANQSLHDDIYLNVIRTADAPFVKTGRFAEELDIVQRTAQKRMNDLEDEGRVDSMDIGSGKIWWLSESETTDPVGEPGARLYKLNNNIEKFVETFRDMWLALFGMSGFLLLIFLTADAQEITLPLFGREGITFIALLLALSAGVALVLWGLLKCVNVILRLALSRGWVGTIGA